MYVCTMYNVCATSTFLIKYIFISRFIFSQQIENYINIRGFFCSRKKIYALSNIEHMSKIELAYCLFIKA